MLQKGTTKFIYPELVEGPVPARRKIILNRLNPPKSTKKVPNKYLTSAIFGTNIRTLDMSDVQTTQIKISIPNELYSYLKSKTEKFGLTTASYIRNLIINDVKDMDLPEFSMSEKREKIALKAAEDYKKGKTKMLDNIDDYLANL